MNRFVGPAFPPTHSSTRTPQAVTRPRSGTRVAGVPEGVQHGGATRSRNSALHALRQVKTATHGCVRPRCTGHVAGHGVQAAGLCPAAFAPAAEAVGQCAALLKQTSPIRPVPGSFRRSVPGSDSRHLAARTVTARPFALLETGQVSWNQQAATPVQETRIENVSCRYRYSSSAPRRGALTEGPRCSQAFAWKVGQTHRRRLEVRPRPRPRRPARIGSPAAHPAPGAALSGGGGCGPGISAGCAARLGRAGPGQQLSVRLNVPKETDGENLTVPP